MSSSERASSLPAASPSPPSCSPVRQPSGASHLQYTSVQYRAVDPHSFFADPDPAVLHEADPDPAAFHCGSGFSLAKFVTN